MTVAEPDYTWAHPLIRRPETRFLILHHAGASGSTARQIHKYHLEKGWSGIAYHYYVRKSGLVCRGRPEDTAGAHTQGYNGVSIGVCFEGNFERESIGETQFEAGRALIRDILRRYPGIRIVGHRELNATACPGARFPLEAYKKLGEETKETETRYQTVAELPEWAAGTVKDLCERGILRGRSEATDAEGYPADLDLSEDMLRLLVWNDRAGVYGGGRT